MTERHHDDEFEWVGKQMAVNRELTADLRETLNERMI